MEPFAGGVDLPRGESADIGSRRPERWRVVTGTADAGTYRCAKYRTYVTYLLNVEHVRPRTGCPNLSLSSTHLDRGFRSVLRVASAIHHSVGTSVSVGNCFARSSMTSSMTSVGVCQLVPSGTLRSMRKWKWARSHISSLSFPG